MQFRPLGPREQPAHRRLFGPGGDGVSWHAAEEELLRHAARRVLFHRIVLSAGAPGEELDLRRWTRLVMGSLGRQLGMELHWVAAVHGNTDHPHVHVLLAGAGERRGGPEPVLLRSAHYVALREAGDRFADRLLLQEQVLGHAVARESAFLDSSLDRKDERNVPAADGAGERHGMQGPAHETGGGSAAALSVAAALAGELAGEDSAARQHDEQPRRRRGPPGRDATRGH
jgi:hypothetical protein